MTMTSLQPQFDTTTFRRALGHVPTSVCVVTVSDEEGSTGMTVGSFTSISLDPPLVGFFADSSSSTFERIHRSGTFTVNLLSEGQGTLCQAFARKGLDRFAGVPLVSGDHVAPRLADALGWIDCKIDSVAPIGDHDAVVGRVVHLDVPPQARRPLVFYRGTLCQLDARTVPSKGNWRRDHYAEW